MKRAYTVQVYATVYVDDDPSVPFEVEVGPWIDPDFLVEDWPEEMTSAEYDEMADAGHGFRYWLAQGVEPVWRFGEGTRTESAT